MPRSCSSKNLTQLQPQHECFHNFVSLFRIKAKQMKPFLPTLAIAEVSLSLGLPLPRSPVSDQLPAENKAPLYDEITEKTNHSSHINILENLNTHFSPHKLTRTERPLGTLVENVSSRTSLPGRDPLLHQLLVGDPGQVAVALCGSESSSDSVTTAPTTL